MRRQSEMSILAESITDDVSALTMDIGSTAMPQHEAGDSSSGGLIMSRLRRNFEEMKLGLPEKMEAESRDRTRRSNRSAQHLAEVSEEQETPRSEEQEEEEEEEAHGDVLLYNLGPLPQSFEDWRKKQKKKKLPQVSSASREKTGAADSRKHEKENDAGRSDDRGAYFPIREVCFQAEPQRTSRSTSRSRSRSRSRATSADVSRERGCPSVASTEASTNSPFSSRQCSVDNFTPEPSPSESLPAGLHPPSSSQRSFAQHSYALTTAASSAYSQISFEDIERLKREVKCARADEKQVARIQRRVDRDIRIYTEEAAKCREKLRHIEANLRSATEERDRLDQFLKRMERDNTRMRSVLVNMEEHEADQRLDAMIDVMESKMLAMKEKLAKRKTRRT